MSKAIVYNVALLLMVAGLVGCGSGDSEDKKATATGINPAYHNEIKKEVLAQYEDFWEGFSAVFSESDNFVLTTGSKISADYEKNEARANNKYKGRTVFIKGKVHNIDAGFGDVPYIKLASNANFNMNGAHVDFHESQIDYPATVDKGQILRFVCTGNSEVMGSPLLKNCYSYEGYKNKLVQDTLKQANKLVRGGVEKLKEEISDIKNSENPVALGVANYYLKLKEKHPEVDQCKAGACPALFRKDGSK